MLEERRLIPGYPDYMVTNTGRVFSIKKLSYLSPKKSFGYLRVGLCQNGKVSYFFIHVLVLTAFVGPRPLGFDSSHLNGNREDNKLENLKWESRSRNNQRKKEHGTDMQGEKHFNAKLTNNDILEIRKMISEGQPTKKIAEKFDIKIGYVNLIKHRTSWRHVK